MTSGKLRTLLTRAFGAEPGTPDISLLADWVAGRRGSTGDLTSFLLEQSVTHQQDAGITMPCAGGGFYRTRVLQSLHGLDGQLIVGEIGADCDAVIADTADAVGIARGCAIALPAPHMLDLTDQYYYDEDEVNIAISGAYRSLMRAMRDAGCGGHVLICDRIEEAEAEVLAKKKVFFFHPSPSQEDLATLLEYQRQVAVRKQDIGMALSLTGEYDITGIVILDPDSAAIRSVLLHKDPENVVAGGYCTGNGADYWRNLVASAVYRA